MQFHHLFRMVKTAGLHLICIKSYSKNTHTSFNLKWILVILFDILPKNDFLKQFQYSIFTFIVKNFEKMYLCNSRTKKTKER